MPQGLACFRIHLLTSPKYPAACTAVLICFLFCLLYTAASVRILSVIQAVTRLPRRTSVCKLAYIYPFLCIYAYNSTSMRPTPVDFAPRVIRRWTAGVAVPSGAGSLPSPFAVRNVWQVLHSRRRGCIAQIKAHFVAFHRVAYPMRRLKVVPVLCRLGS